MTKKHDFSQTIDFLRLESNLTGKPIVLDNLFLVALENGKIQNINPITGGKKWQIQPKGAGALVLFQTDNKIIAIGSKGVIFTIDPNNKRIASFCLLPPDFLPKLFGTTHKHDWNLFNKKNFLYLVTKFHISMIDLLNNYDYNAYLKLNGSLESSGHNSAKSFFSDSEQQKFGCRVSTVSGFYAYGEAPLTIKDDLFFMSAALDGFYRYTLELEPYFNKQIYAQKAMIYPEYVVENKRDITKWKLNVVLINNIYPVLNNNIKLLVSITIDGKPLLKNQLFDINKRSWRKQVYVAPNVKNCLIEVKYSNSVIFSQKCIIKKKICGSE